MQRITASRTALEGMKIVRNSSSRNTRVDSELPWFIELLVDFQHCLQFNGVLVFGILRAAVGYRMKRTC